MEKKYPPESVGSIMSTAIPTCRGTDKLEDILRNLPERKWESVRNVYVLGTNGNVLGAIDIASLVHADHTVQAASLMQPMAHFLHPEDDQEKAVFLAVKEDIVSVPVVGHDGRFLGSVTAHTIIDIMHAEHIEDALLTAGIRHAKKAEIIKLATDRTSLVVQSRAPWIVVGLVAGLGLGLLSSVFEAQLQERVALAFFIPVVAYIAGAVGTQTQAIAIRALATMKVSYWDYLSKELLVGSALGAIVGTVGAVGASFIGGSFDIGAVVGLSLFCASLVSSVLASVIPIIFKIAGKDPALGSGPLATALQDVISVLIYFMLAVIIL